MPGRIDLLSGEPLEEPGDHAPERADAARNRARVLAAAQRLFRERGPHVTMGEIARAAEVGRGTLYRRYPDVASIARALLDEHEREVQAQLLGGTPPLGPGAPPAERLAAFYDAMVTLLDQHVHLVLGAEAGTARFATGAYDFWRAHVHALLAEARVPGSDALVDTLLAPLAPEVFSHQRHELGLSTGSICAGLHLLAYGVLGEHRREHPSLRPTT